ncbi:hypothetical protein RMSM_02175 [Rhodopirellula maiorica SM1]|uniref:Uncharacterized protein n=1 Tax=Rhodopirellula maiorica SM1 TaxID=1265738 RepID=M5RNM5_9BACT|nr:hypothetical protein RMSM_02175 [Rhodopirellula maiorica SM1]
MRRLAAAVAWLNYVEELMQDDSQFSVLSSFPLAVLDVVGGLN